MVPSFKDTQTLDEYFIMGRTKWPDLSELKDLRLDRSRVPDKVVTFIRSTALNEHGIVHYTKGYFRSFGDDYKLGIWASMWGGEEYLHSIVLRAILKALGDEISPEEFRGLETGAYAVGYDDYLERIKVSPRMSRRFLQLIYGVIQEYAAYIAYSSVSKVCGDPVLRKLLMRIAKDEMRHCRFFQLCLEAMAENVPEEERELIWAQFNALFKTFQMPQEFIAMFGEQKFGTDLYIGFWTPEHRAKIVLYLAHYFRKFRKTPVSAATVTPAAAATA